MTSFWINAIVFVSGFTLGAVMKLGYAKVAGRKVIIPFITSSSRNLTILATLLGAVSVLTILQVEWDSQEDRRCDREFRTALDYNTAITADQRVLDKRTDELNAARHEVIDNVFVELAKGVNPAAFKTMVNQYNTETGRINAEIDRLMSERESLDRNRKPYPEPTCGNA